jgi:hypothetical protein
VFTVVALSVLALGLAACGSNDDAGDDGGNAKAADGGAPATSEDEVRAAYQAFVDGVYSADYERACASISPAYLKKVSPGMPCRRALRNAFGGATPVAAKPRILTVDVHGRSARLTAKSRDALRTSQFRLVDSGGRWLITRQSYSDS